MTDLPENFWATFLTGMRSRVGHSRRSQGDSSRGEISRGDGAGRVPGMAKDRRMGLSLKRSAPDRRHPFDTIGTLVVDQLPDPLLLLDEGGRIFYGNREALTLFGDRVAGRPLASVLRSPALLTAVERVHRSGCEENIDYVLPVPVERYFQVLIRPLEKGLPAGHGQTAEKKEKKGLLVSFHDLTRSRRVEQMRVDFVAHASHELKTPLASLSGFIETLQGHARDDPRAQKRFLEIMAEQTGRMQRLVDDLLSLSRIELREHVPPSGKVSLPSLLSDVVDSLAPIARQLQVVLDVDPGPADLPAVRGEWDELHQVIQNLADNAIKYGKSGGRVVMALSAYAEGSRSYVRVHVRDFGSGIAREHIPRLTERFYRVDVTQSREKGGTGLGLAIVKHIVNRHSGTLMIESREGAGSCFTIQLPACGSATLHHDVEPQD